MKSINKYFYFTMVCAMVFALTSCESDDSVFNDFQLADLEVFVSGTLSGNPRSGLSVAIYDTEEDAMNEVNRITSSQFTDSNGNAIEFNRGKVWVEMVPLKNDRLDGELSYN